MTPSQQFANVGPTVWGAQTHRCQYQMATVQSIQHWLSGSAWGISAKAKKEQQEQATTIIKTIHKEEYSRFSSASHLNS